MNNSNNVYDVVAIGVNNDKALVYNQELLRTGDTMQIGTAFSLSNKLVLDIKSISQTRYSNSSNNSKESVRYLLDEKNPFQILLEDGSTKQS